MNKRSADEWIVLGISFLCLLGLAPFAVIRLTMGTHWVAAMDIFGAVCALSCFIYVWRTHQTRVIAPLIAIVSLAGMTSNIYRLGIDDLYFMYPVLIAAYFLLRPWPAVIATTLAVIVISLILVNQVSLFDTVKAMFSLLATVLFTFLFAWQRNRQHEELKQLSRVDALTGAGNRRALREQLDSLIHLHARDRQPMSLIFLDMDDFKVINDEFGHLVGDQVLKRVAELIQQRIRSTDYLYRYGGDEFMVLANHSDIATTHVLANDIRERVVQDRAVTGKAVSVSVGVSEYQMGETADQWLARADQAMYSAKDSGKNAVSIAELTPKEI